MSEIPHKGSYRRSDAYDPTDTGDRCRSHQTGNPRPEIDVNSVGRACDRWFQGEGMKPSISKILQTRGVEIGVKRWVSRKSREFIGL